MTDSTSPAAVVDDDARAPRLIAAVAVLAGLAASVYLTIEHYTHGTSFACPESATINCLKVTTSKWSVIAGVPVAVLGLVYFVAMTVFVLARLRDRRLRLLRVLAAGVGVISALYLVCIELFAVDAICLWCTAVHICALVLFGATIWRDTGLAGPGI